MNEKVLCQGNWDEATKVRKKEKGNSQSTENSKEKSEDRNSSLKILSEREDK